jgi:hypothetical protein
MKTEQRMRRSRRTTDLALESAVDGLRAKAELERRRLRIPERPEETEVPSAPDNPTALSDVGLMSRFGRLTRWQDYLGGQVSVAEIDERCAEAIVKRVESLFMLRNSPAKGEVTKTRAEMHEDPEVEAWREEYRRRHAHRKLLSVIYANVERNASFLSREVSRRIGRQEVHERRADRWSS